MGKVKFIKDPEAYTDESAFVAHLTGLSETKDELLNEISKKLHFPNYFGFNWDALSDCLKDFDWIEKKVIILVHDRMPPLTEPILKTYIKILAEATIDLEKWELHYFEVVFPEHTKRYCKSIYDPPARSSVFA